MSYLADVNGTPLDDQCGAEIVGEAVVAELAELRRQLAEAQARIAKLEEARKDTEALDSGRICLPIVAGMQHTWSGVDLRAAIDKAREHAKE